MAQLLEKVRWQLDAYNEAKRKPGTWDDAVKWYRKALDSYQRCGNEAAAAVAGTNLAEVLVSQRALDEAEPMLRESIRILRSSRALDDVLFAEIQLGRLLVERGDNAVAVEHLIAVRGEAAAIGQVGYAFEAAMHLAAAFAAQDLFDIATETLDDAVAGMGFVDPLYQPTLARVRAMTLTGTGQLVDSRQVLELGLVSAREQGLRYEEGLLLLASLQVDRAAGIEPSASLVAMMTSIFALLHVDIEVPVESVTGTADRHDRRPATS